MRWNALLAASRGVGARVKVCPFEGKVIEPREPNLVRIIHLFYKEPILYNGIKNVLHLYLRYAGFIWRL